ncbi:hypothetical protein SDC9_110219 [bioreactor metagenome]|uniref:Uncharacterized protein n=1 Tax=bioreactor metagenome TaxID=1076179 RepID=A0A645BCY2_9ZZZZ
MQPSCRDHSALAFALKARGNARGVERIVKDDTAFLNRLGKIPRRILRLEDESLGERVDKATQYALDSALRVAVRVVSLAYDDGNAGAEKIQHRPDIHLFRQGQHDIRLFLLDELP